jgi:serine/threonine protein kinase
MEFAGYSCFKEISRGPVTSVYLCRSGRSDQVLLLKTLNPQYNSDHEMSKRFSREANLYKKLKHPNIVDIIELGKSDNQYYLVMEYIEGWPLDRFLKSFYPISVNDSVAIISQILAGLNYAHTRGVVHRDIKPSNILIGTDGIVKLTDFGLARQIDISAITEHGNIIGTPAYMAPEVLGGKESTYQSDIFSLGITWHEILTGSNPFRGDSIPESINNILNKNIIPISLKNEDVPDWLDSLILQMLEKNPEERIDNCNTVLGNISVQNAHAIPENFAHILLQTINYKKIPPVFQFDNIPENRVSRSALKMVLTALAIVISLVIVYSISKNISNIPELSVKQDSSIINRLPLVEETSKNFDSNFVTNNTESFSNDQIVQPENIINDVSAKLHATSDSLVGEDEQNQAAPGGIYIDVYPWADIYIAGAYYATTPISENIMLAPGKYNFELRNPAHETMFASIDIKSNMVDTLQFWLDEIFGQLSVRVKPWGKIYINDEFVDTTPLGEPLRLKSGRYQVLIKNPYFSDYKESVEIVAGQTYELSVNMSK